MIVPLSEPDITELEIEAVVSVLKSSRLSLGPKLEEFENSIASYIGIPYAIAVSSGTAGLHLCIRALGIGPGDEVIVPSFTFIAAANAIRFEGATPVFVDIDSKTLNVNPVRIEEAITPKTRAIMAVHSFGIPAKMDAILAMAKRHNLLVIEDACEALGAEYGRRRVGTFGDAAVFAFYPNKQITTGEGGMVVCRDPAFAQTIRALRNQGRFDSDAWHQHSILGYNYRLSELNCALGVVQMSRIDELLTKREHVAAAYSRSLRNCPGLELPSAAELGTRISWFVYVVRVDEGRTLARRDRIFQHLKDAGIQCGRYFAPIHQQPAYQDWPLPHPLPITEAESCRTLALPFSTKLTEDQITYVANHLHAALDGTRD